MRRKVRKGSTARQSWAEYDNNNMYIMHFGKWFGGAKMEKGMEIRRKSDGYRTNGYLFLGLHITVICALFLCHTIEWGYQLNVFQHSFVTYFCPWFTEDEWSTKEYRLVDMRWKWSKWKECNSTKIETNGLKFF